MDRCTCNPWNYHLNHAINFETDINCTIKIQAQQVHYRRLGTKKFQSLASWIPLNSKHSTYLNFNRTVNEDPPVWKEAVGTRVRDRQAKTRNSL